MAAVSTRHPSASDAVDWSASLHNFFLLPHLYTVEAAASVQLCKTGKRFYNYDLHDFCLLFLKTSVSPFTRC